MKILFSKLNINTLHVKKSNHISLLYWLKVINPLSSNFSSRIYSNYKNNIW